MIKKTKSVRIAIQQKQRKGVEREVCRHGAVMIVERDFGMEGEQMVRFKKTSGKSMYSVNKRSEN
jgi:DNA gyrase inhibitor GyrI